jgi:hypothetical protein
MALQHAIPAPVAGIEIHLVYTLAPKHDLELAAIIEDTIRDAIQITIAHHPFIINLAHKIFFPFCLRSIRVTF